VSEIGNGGKVFYNNNILVAGAPYMVSRIVEAYTGEYAAGKSENALNRALERARCGRKVTLVDLDLVEPVYTLRPVQDELRLMGIEVIAWRTEDITGLGKAGTILNPAARWALRREGDVILDLGYGTEGIRTLNLVVRSTGVMAPRTASLHMLR